MPAIPTLHLFRALNNRNYRLFFFGQFFSLLGTWMQTMALSWLVYRLTRSTLLLGTVGFAGQLPLLLLTPLAGVLADRWPRRNLLLGAEALSLAQALILAWLTFAGHIAIWQILALTVFLGIVAAFEMPTRQAFTLDMIERVEDLPNAIALNSSLFNASRLVGPSLAGVMIASIGEAGCFLINGLSYLAILLALWAMRLPRPVVTKAKKPLLHDLLAGFRYGWNFTPIRNILLLLALLSLMGMPYAVLMPVFAKDILRGGPHTLGILMAASGFGALIGTIYLAGRKSVLGLGAQLPLMAGCFGVGLIGFAFSKNLVLSAACLALSGFGMMTSMASSNTILQSIAEEDKRGRLMSLYTLALAGVAPFGSLMAGTFAKYLGAPRTVAAGGAACMIAAGLFALQIESLRRQIHPIYTQKGILPEVAKGLGAASTVTTYTQEN